jgi:3-hydroxyacyl-CoA dehydrogenase
MTLGAGHPMGPLALLDMVGLDVSAAIGEQIGAEVPRPSGGWWPTARWAARAVAV